MADSENIDPWIGCELSSYVVIKQIGHGGMGVIYLGRHRSLDRLAAIKFLAAQLVSDEVSVQLFLREAKAAANLSHPNIVTIYDAGQANDDIFYFVMEYVEGRDLRSVQESVGALPVRDAVEYIRQAANALAYAHRKHIIHRDIKPENLMLTRDGTIKVGDLGLAKWVGDPDGYMTQQGMVYGSPFYISPERLRDAKCADPQSDIYSLGASLFHLVTGRLPYEGSTPVVMAAHLSDPVPDPADANPRLDKELCAIIQKMMSKDLKDRFQSMEQVEDALIDYQLEHYHASPALRRDSRPLGKDTRSGDKSESRSPAGQRLVLLWRAGAVLAIAVIALFVFWKKNPEPPADQPPKAAPVSKPAPPQPLPPPPSSGVQPPLPSKTVIVPPQPGTDQSWNTMVVPERPESTAADSPGEIALPSVLADFNSPETSGTGLSTTTSFPPNPPSQCTASLEPRLGINGSDALVINYDLSEPGSFCGVVLGLGEKSVGKNNYVRMKIRTIGQSSMSAMIILKTGAQSGEDAVRYKAEEIPGAWKTIEFPLKSNLPIREMEIQLRHEWSGSKKGYLAIDDVTLLKK